jgi:formylglycine-generating enzyme required for sulfatase activity
MEDFGADLARLRRGEPAAARPFGPARRASRWARRRPAAAALIAFAFLFPAVAAAVTAAKNRELGRHLERVSAAARRAGDALSAAEGHLVRYERLSDRRRVADLEARAARLVPPHPDVRPALQAWLAEARPLGGRLEEHREALVELRTRGVARASRESAPGEATTRSQDGPPSSGIAATRLAREIASLKARQARMLASADPQPAEPHLRGHIERLEASLPRIDRWSYPSDALAWHDEALSALMADLERFADPDPRHGTIAEVEQRVADVRTIEESLAANEAAWSHACRSIGDRSECPRYGGLVIRPQLGLVPLGRDRTSGLWEFLHVLSGALPPRATDGGIEMTPESGIVLVLIPGGVTRIGARRPGPGDPPLGAHLDPLAEPDESPPMDVTLDPFFISKFEMTYQQWVRAGGRGAVRRLRVSEVGVPIPVAGIDWTRATRTLERVALELPTESQWEHAARAGTTTPWWTGADESSLKGAAVLATKNPEPVGGRIPNAFGLHDVAGNVAEWCRDVYVMYRSSVPGTGESPPDGGDLRVHRGGGFHDEAASRLRSAFRMEAPPSFSLDGNGIRPARRVDR